MLLQDVISGSGMKVSQMSTLWVLGLVNTHLVIMLTWLVYYSLKTKQASKMWNDLKYSNSDYMA